MIKAIVFDFDGLIFDTETHEYKVLQEIFEDHGAELPLEIWGKCVGTRANFFDAFQYLEECIGKPVDREVLGKLRREKFEVRIANERALPGVENYLAAAKHLGLKVGLASSSGRAWVERWLAYLNLLHHFECVRTADDVEHVKPDPTLYLKAVECLGVEPNEAIAFEDSPNGALAAKRAGLHTVVVPNYVTRDLIFGEHDLRLDSLAEMELEQLIERVVQKG
ncbi:HAD family hydrolase [Effusibacillus lacus]|uniref:HAD family hydrolase n=1 Tax=Effusibacillus lacus TaxID=1348429 RepID=A0A292YC53_9BACL|nr:HAD family hydrolase [Effusibacillus lacus]TCS74325.1 HAD superfamily hydrolase (TIGR01509 family) [Effusibacillus lacus]GAX88782.1 hypothetical protein EFBL_0396 [Effusibacillus lacus]